jgi:hypothetical protein
MVAKCVSTERIREWFRERGWILWFHTTMNGSRGAFGSIFSWRESARAYAAESTPQHRIPESRRVRMAGRECVHPHAAHPGFASGSTQRVSARISWERVGTHARTHARRID